MTLFDVFFFNIFKHYKPKYKRKANSIALFYVSMLQICLLLLVGVIVALFLKEMNSSTISSGKAWSLFIMAGIFIHFRNWVQYTGKKRSLLNLKKNRKLKLQHYNIWMLWSLLVGCLVLFTIFYMAL